MTQTPTLGVCSVTLRAQMHTHWARQGTQTLRSGQRRERGRLSCSRLLPGQELPGREQECSPNLESIETEWLHFKRNYCKPFRECALQNENSLSKLS